MIIPKGHDYKNLLFIFTNKPYVKMIIPATNNDKKTNKLHHIFITNHYRPSLTKLNNSLLSPFYIDTTQTFSFYKTYI